jgi:hypothetical protein
MDEPIYTGVPSEIRALCLRGRIGRTVEPSLRAIEKREQEIEKFKKIIQAHQTRCSHRPVILKEHLRSRIFSSGGTIYVRQGCDVRVCCIDCLAVYMTRLYSNYAAICGNCLEPMARIDSAAGAVSIMTDSVEGVVEILSLYECHPCTLALVLYQ